MTSYDGSPESFQTQEFLSSATSWIEAEVDVILSSDHWAIINNGSDSTKHRLYDAAALRHTCDVLESIKRNAEAGDELAVRTLGRAHVEAWLTAVYLHFGGHDALQRVAADTLNETQVTDDAIKRYDAELATRKKKANKSLKAVQAANKGIKLWNAQHPDLQKPLLPEAHVPKQPKAEIDLSTRIAVFTGIEAQNLPLSVIADKLTVLGPEKGFADESFGQVYLYYRLMSGASVHPTLHLYDSYFEHPRGYFVHTSQRPTGHSVILATWSTALYATALLVGWVLRDTDHPTPVADFLRSQLETEPATTGGWAPKSGSDTQGVTDAGLGATG